MHPRKGFRCGKDANKIKFEEMGAKSLFWSPQLRYDLDQGFKFPDRSMNLNEALKPSNKLLHVFKNILLKDLSVVRQNLNRAF